MKVYANKRMKRKLIKPTAIVVASFITLNVAVVATSFKIDPETVTYSYTEEDLEENKETESVLAKLDKIDSEETIEFQNTELAELIISRVGSTKKSDLDKLSTLIIKDTLENTNLSELKYLTNLSYLSISNNQIDLDDIKYNQNLNRLDIKQSTVINTESIPNTTKSLYFDEVTCDDEVLSIPYFTTSVSLTDCNLKGIYLKDTHNLRIFKLCGDTYLDLSIFSECDELQSLEIKQCSNVTNASSLLNSSSLLRLKVDDYSPIWLTDEIAKTYLTTDDYEYFSEQINALDEIAESLNLYSDISSEEKIKNIVIHIIENMEYDEVSKSDTPAASANIKFFNSNPIYYALKGNGVCINYATYFKALANRAGLDNIVLHNEDHAWNAVLEEETYKGYDVTYLDDTPIILSNNTYYKVSGQSTVDYLDNNREDELVYYEFNLDSLLDDDHLADNFPEQVEEIKRNIGYIDESKHIRIIFNDSPITLRVAQFGGILAFLIIISELIKCKRNAKLPLLKKVKTIKED